jgi:DNA-directed RNA polymerase subunit RPC12/RpoP
MNDELNAFSSEAGCPKCGSGIVSPVKYTWWGGLLGPKLLHHTRCEVCNYRYNSKTRKPNTAGIIIYSVILFVIVLAGVYFLRTM